MSHSTNPSTVANMSLEGPVQDRKIFVLIDDTITSQADTQKKVFARLMKFNSTDPAENKGTARLNPVDGSAQEELTEGSNDTNRICKITHDDVIKLLFKKLRERVDWDACRAQPREQVENIRKSIVSTLLEFNIPLEFVGGTRSKLGRRIVKELCSGDDILPGTLHILCESYLNGEQITDTEGGLTEENYDALQNPRDDPFAFLFMLELPGPIDTFRSLGHWNSTVERKPLD